MSEPWGNELWRCDECQAPNGPEEYECRECGTERPRSCDLCGSWFSPWSETSKGNAKIHKHTCMKCHKLTEQEPLT